MLVERCDALSGKRASDARVEARWEGHRPRFTWWLGTQVRNLLADEKVVPERDADAHVRTARASGVGRSRPSGSSTVSGTNPPYHSASASYRAPEAMRSVLQLP